MSINIDQLCQDAENLVGKATYTNKSAGESECLVYSKLAAGGQTVMCAGLIVALLKKYGVSIYNGSNTIWRKYLSDSGSVSDHKSSNGYPKNVNALSSSQLEKGMVVFKWNSSDTDKYPDGKGDYQHIGIVTSVKPLHIVHSTSENLKGVVMDTSIGKFCAWGKLKCIDYGTTDTSADTATEEVKGDDKMSETVIGSAVVNANPSLNVRSNPSTSSRKIGTLKNGSIVNLIEKTSDDWYAIMLNDDTNGYVMAKFLTDIEFNDDGASSTNDDTASDDGGTSSTDVDFSKLDNALEEAATASAALTAKIKAIRKMLG